MTTYTFTIPGAPYPLKRARRAQNGRMFDPRENIDAKRAIGFYARRHMPELTQGPVELTMWFYMPRPKSHFGKRGLRASAPTEHMQKPDVDNLIKAVMDGMTGVAWRDDVQVVGVRARKAWCDGEGRTDVEVSVKEVNHAQG